MGVVAVRFRDMDRWNVSYFKGERWLWPASQIKAIADFTKPENVSFSVADAKRQNIPIISKISFSGELFLRPSKDYEGYKGRLFLVQPGRIIFSKINARRGCILFVTHEHGNFAVSGEYPVLNLNADLAIGEYVDLALRTKKARTELMGSAAGMAKARTYLNDFQSIEIPLPPLEVQRAIVARWQAAQQSAREVEEQVRQIGANAEKQFFADLGLKPIDIDNVERPKFFTVMFSQLEQWGVRQTTDKLLGLDHLPEAKYPIILLGNCSAVSYGIQKSPANRPGEYARPYLRVANVRKGYLDLTEVKEINVPDNEMDYYRLEKGDILFVEGNGSRAELGRVGMWNGEIENCVHQNHLIKVRVDPQKLVPEYVMTWFNTELGRSHFFRSAKTSSGLGTINSQEVKKAPIPLPPLETQQAILEKVHASRAEIARQKERAAQLRREAEAEVEALILGTKKTEEPPS